jgi:DNA-directed RNA polymerase subunit beta'
VPLSAEAQAEARILMLSSNNILKPADGKPVTMPTQDMVIGLYYLTHQTNGAKGEGRVFSSDAEARMAFDNGELHLQAPVKIRLREVIGVDNGAKRRRSGPRARTCSSRPRWAASSSTRRCRRGTGS